MCTYFVVVVIADGVLICIGSTVDALRLYFSLAVSLSLVVPTSASFIQPQKTSPTVEKVPPYIIPIQWRASRANSFLFDCDSKNMKFGFLFSFLPRSEIHSRASATEARVCAGK